MLRNAMLATVALLATSCDARTPDPGKANAPAQATASKATAPQPPATPAPTAAATARSVKVENALYDFEYAYPAKAAAIPALKAQLETRLATARTELEKSARADQVEAAKDNYPYRKHSDSVEWQVVTDLPGWLSLSAERYEYSGGAHGMTFYDALLWDREQASARVPLDLFLSKPALSGAIRQPFCAALNKERAKRRGEPVPAGSKDGFDECIDPAEHTVILGSGNGRTFDRIGVMVEPYAAGPYAEGSYEITLPVTQRLIEAVKPAYKAAFSAR